jgi:hypothetical protein
MLLADKATGWQVCCISLISQRDRNHRRALSFAACYMSWIIERSYKNDAALDDLDKKIKIHSFGEIQHP